LGQRLWEVEHTGWFTFSHDPDEPDSPDAFADPQITAKLALAARSTASFPAVFEPSFIPVSTPAGAPVDTAADDPHQDMGGIASFAASRYVIDGGVLLKQADSAGA
jgi:hypothetical protein